MVRSGKNGELHLKQISYYKQTGGYHPTTLASERSGIRRAAKKFVFKDNKLFYVGKDKRQMRLVILSEEDKRKVLENCHENHSGTHHGISRTLTLVESQYYWTSVTSDVKQWVNACQHCQVGKNIAIVPPRFHSIKAVDPWTILNLDLLGPFGATNKNHMYVILLTDVFTKWAVILPLHDLSAAEVARAVVHASFSYGLPQKIAIPQGEEFVHQINGELFEFLGMKELIMPYPESDHEYDIGERIRSFLLKYCTENTQDWDDHLEAIAYAFNLFHSKKDQNTPYFELFQRNPYMPSPSGVVQERKNDCLFARIVTAVKQAEKAGQESARSSCQDMKKMHVKLQKGSKHHIRKKPKQWNPYLLKVGHEVLRQRKNWWKDGSFRSEWIGPCIIDYITDNGFAILRDVAGSRLKRPIKIAHLKPYIRGSQEQDSHIWQSAHAIDHDYIASAETAMKQSLEDTFFPNGQSPPAPEDAVLERDLVLTKNNGQLEFIDTHSTDSIATNSKQWSAPCWALQNKTEAT